jgi:hypothetical protein
LKFALLIQLESDCSVFTLAAIFELTREVFLPDQSDAHTTSSAKTAQELFGKNTVDICARNVQNTRLKKARTASVPEDFQDGLGTLLD